MKAAREPSLLVLGLGNVLCGDDGLGVAAVERLEREYDLPPGVRVLDGGTLGMTLLGYFEAGDDVILVDAIRAAGPPGTFVRLAGDAVAPAVRDRLSCHQIGVHDLLDGLRLLGAFPRRLVLLGLVPESIELELGLTPSVAAALPRLVTAVVDEAGRLGHDFAPRAADDASATPRHAAAGLALGV